MAPASYSLLAAAKLLQDTRYDIKAGTLGAHLSRVSTAGTHVDAGLSTENVLVVTGSSSMSDYLFYNLRPWRVLPKMPEIDALTSEELPRRAFHKGFLLHAARVLAFLGDDRPDYIVGHSLGAAAAQILGNGLGIPTICLASPQVVKKRFLQADPLRLKTHSQWNVFNMAWSKDFVTRGYRAMGMRCLGHRVQVGTKDPNFGIDHFVSDYENIIMLADQYDVAGLPQHWPHTSFDTPNRLV